MSVTIRDYDLRETFKFEKKLLIFAGIYPAKSKKKFWYFVSIFVDLFLSLGQILSMSVQMIIDRKDLSKLCEALQYFITLATFACKASNLVLHGKNLMDIEDSLALPTFYGFSENCFNLLKERIGSCKTLAKFYRIFCMIGIGFYILSPYLDHKDSKVLILPGWFPYNATKYYYPSYIFQIVGITNTAFANSTIDILTWMSISIVSGQFDMLKENLKNIDWKNDDVKITAEKFKNCIKHHREIVKLVHKIERCFSGGIFLQFFATVIVICFIGLLLLIVPVLSMQFGFLIISLMVILCQLAMYCWYGHDVMTTSSGITESFYVSNWYESDLTIRKSVLVFLERTNKPFTLRAGGIVILSLTTLTSVLKSSYSYFAVLQHLYNNS